MAYVSDRAVDRKVGGAINDDMLALARSIPIEAEIARRGIKLKRSGAEWIGPCPRCGGTHPKAVLELPPVQAGPNR